jgi:DNA phosphorothioation-dependent restriction protein DptG
MHCYLEIDWRTSSEATVNGQAFLLHKRIKDAIRELTRCISYVNGKDGLDCDIHPLWITYKTVNNGLETDVSQLMQLSSKITKLSLRIQEAHTPADLRCRERVEVRRHEYVLANQRY